MGAGWRRAAWTGTVAAVMAACAEPPPDNTPDPCAVLGTECPYCTQPGPKGTCENALATSDDVQCTVALDDPDVIADCVVPDGGTDASLGGSTDASALPACDAAEVAPDAGCACVPPCETTCPGGGCTIGCPGGHTCEGSCSGGNCVFQCGAGATCTDSCDGGGCTFQCADNAVCNDTCASTSPCVFSL